MIYEPVGGLRVSGCAVKRSQKRYETYFSIGSKAWIKQKAIVGILETIYIKKIYRTVSENYKYQGIQPSITYVDTFNRVWLEDELIWEERAIDFAKIHWQKVKKFMEDYVVNNCPPEPPCGT